MENSLQNYDLSYNGEGKDLFKIFIANWLLTVITLGIYYPWAKANTLKYYYENTTLNNEPFKFSGTGKEMFKGFIKSIIILGLIYSIPVIFTYFKMPILGGIIFYLLILSILPFIIHGTMKYRLSRSSWQNIRFGYRGNLQELIKKCLKWSFYTIISLGFYAFGFKLTLENIYLKTPA